MHYINPERAPYNQTANPFAGDDEPLPGVKDVNKAYEVAVKKVSHFPSKPLTDMESESAGIKSKRQMKDEADDVKTSNEVAKQEQANGDKGLLSKLRDGASGLWDGVKNTASSVLNAGANALGSVADTVGDAAKAVGSAVTGAWNQAKALSGSNREKYNKIRGAALSAGDPHPDIVAAQWALESGWGKKQSGRHNYFGIKAQKGESGTTVRTREVYGGKSVMINDSFKNYNSLEEGIADRVAFIKRNPRYTKAGYYIAKTPYEAAVALQKGGYATDPNYANLLCKIIKGAGYDPGKASSANTQTAGNKNANDGALTRGVDSVKNAASNAGHAVGAAAVGVRAQTAGAVAGGVTAVNQTSAKIVDGAKSALGAATGNAAVGSDSTTDGKGKNGTPWMKLAEKQVGVNEDDHEGIVRDYHKVGGSLNAGGKTPWCASFIGWVLEKSGIRSTRSAAANSYDKWGQKLAKTNIPFGAIIRVRFKDGNHVAFCTGDKGGARISTLGGNQSSKKGGSRRNGGEVTLSSVARSEIVSVSYPEGYKPSGGSLSGSVGGAATPEAGEAGAAAVGDSGSTGATGAASSSGIQWTGRTNGKTTFDAMSHLDQLQGKTTPATTAIAGYGAVNAAANSPGIKASAAPGTTPGMAKQINADLSGVKKAEAEAGMQQAREAEADRVAKANSDAKSRRITQTGMDAQSDVVNIMRENLAETKRMNQTLLSINKGIQTLVASSGNSLRGEAKALPNANRPPTPPENVPVSMRV